MNILFLDQFGEPGGAQQSLLDTVQAVQDRGWNARVMLPGNGPLVEQFVGRKVSVSEIPCGPYNSGSKSWADILRFGTDLRQQRRAIADQLGGREFDLVYVNGPRLLPAAALSVPPHTPVLFHAHSHIQPPYAARLAGWSLRYARASLIACSHSVAQPLVPYVKNVRVIPNGVRDIGFRQRAFPREASWCIGVVGRVAPEKGQLEFVRAAALVRNEFPHARFVIRGAPLFSSSNYIDAVREAAHGLPVQFLEWRADVASTFSELDLLVVPSQREGMGRVVVEAFSAGVPVVAFPVGGVPEIVTDGQTGFLTGGVSPEALAARICDVMASEPEALHGIAANARRAWERSYTVAAYQKQITDQVERLVSAGPAECGTEALLPHR